MSQTPMEAACDEIIQIYHTAGHGQDTLDRNEFKKMMDKQFPNWVKEAQDPEGISELLKDLDKDNNEQLNFEDFMALIGKVAIRAHKKFHEHDGTEHPPSQGH